jgi:hypothetical protein
MTKNSEEAKASLFSSGRRTIEAAHPEEESKNPSPSNAHINVMNQESHETFAQDGQYELEDYEESAEERNEDLRLIQIEKQKRMLQLQILELEKIEMQHKIRARSHSAKRSRKSGEGIRPQDFFREENQMNTLNEENDIIMIEKKGRRANHRRYNNESAESSFEYFGRDQISDTYQRRSRGAESEGQRS